MPSQLAIRACYSGYCSNPFYYFVHFNYGFRDGSIGFDPHNSRSYSYSYLKVEAHPYHLMTSFLWQSLATLVAISTLALYYQSDTHQISGCSSFLKFGTTISFHKRNSTVTTLVQEQQLHQLHHLYDHRRTQNKYLNEPGPTYSYSLYQPTPPDPNNVQLSFHSTTTSLESKVVLYPQVYWCT